MPYYSKEQIAEARQMDLLTYLRHYEPQELVHVTGNTYSTREHDSLKISNGKWMWWSRGIGGASALDFLIKVRGIPFTEAVGKLINEEAATPSFSLPKKESAKPKRLLLPAKSPTNTEVIKYLTARGIDREIIETCIGEGRIYESLPYHNCIFVGYDSAGEAKYASYRAVTPQRIMGDAAGSDKTCGFRISCKGRTVHVFESAIDLLSYATIMKARTGDWRKETMLSLGGVYAPAGGKQMKIPAALTRTLDERKDIDTIALHLDSDYAGRSAAAAIKTQMQGKYRIRDEPPPKGKDYNDYLLSLRRRERKEVRRNDRTER